jgi:hypothetical protein
VDQLFSLSHMRRVLQILALSALIVAVLCLVRWFSVSPAARAARPYAREFAAQLAGDARFTNVHVRVLQLGSKGPLYVTGTVKSDADRTELRRLFDSLHCPVEIGWQVAVVTNGLDGVR